MKNLLPCSLLFVIFFLVFSGKLFAQNYTVLGNATSYNGCSCYKLTDDANNQGGAVFQNRTINLNNAFDYTFSVFLGCNNGGGADGECFVLTSNPNGLGQIGGGLGYSGGNQPFSLAVEFDTYQNGWDPPYSHIAIESGGNIQHNVAAPVPALVSQAPMDDCNWHTVRIVWNPATGAYSVYFDGVLRQSIIIPNMVATYFGGNPIVNWGWSAATGGARDEQRVCIISTSGWVTTGVNYQSCSSTVQFSDISTSSVGSIQGWAWTFGDGGTSTLQNPSHTYATAGTFTVSLVITDNTGCTFSYSHTVIVYPPVALTSALANPTCNGNTDGSVGVTPSGGSGPAYSFSWNGGVNQQQTYSNIGAGTYTVSVTDGTGCTATGTYTLTQPSAITASTTHTDATCGHTDGSVSIAITGGTPPYTGVSWNGTGGYTVNNLSPGTYIANFHDANGCSAALQYREIVNQLPCNYTLSSSGSDVTCFGGSNGSATLTVTGGAAPITITWVNAGTNLNAGSGATISGLTAATYNYTYHDGNNQTFTGSVVVSQPAAVVANITTINTTCGGINNGQALVSVASGGVTPFIYTWSRGQPNTPIDTGLSPGPISVTVTDGNGCTATATGNITGPPLFTAPVAGINDSCYQGHLGSATVSPTGGNPPYTFYWSNISSAQTDLSLGMGTYTVTVTDSRNCTVTNTVTINQPPQFLHTLTSTNINCFGAVTGTITVTASGGIPAYSYLWSPNSVTGATPTGLAAGQYNLTLTDNHNCTILDSVVLTQPATALTATSSHTNVTCFGANNGTVTIIVGGGSPPYSFMGNPIPAGTNTLNNLAPGNYAGALQDANGCSVNLSETITSPGIQSLTLTQVNDVCYGASTGTATANFVNATGAVVYNWSNSQTGANITGLAAATYTVTATDANSCTQTGSVTITQPTAYSLTVATTNVSCFGGNGSATANPVGGTPNYTYAWSAGGATTQTVSLAAGNYFVTVTDNNLCTLTGPFNITQPAAALNAVTAHTDVTCFGANNGTVTITISGGTAPYTYQGNPIPAGTNTLNNLSPATYAGTITDANGCTFNISETVSSPGPQSLTLNHTDNICYGASAGTATANFVNATGAVVYNWSNSQTGANITGLAAGTYTITATDANTCTQTGSVTITQPAAYSLTVATTNVSCFGGNGSATANPVGGTPNYTYAWSAGGATTQTVSPAAGNYFVTVTDNNLCTLTSPFSITQPAAALNAVTAHTDVTCFGANNGTVTITISGGTVPYTYQGNPIPAGTNTLNNLSPATYAGTITDANGCTFNISETVSSPGPQSLTLNHTDNVCFGATNGTASANFVNATGAVVYNWSNSQTGANITGLAAGTYTITATDANTCTQTGSLTVTEPAAVVMNIATVPATCYGGNGTATANPTGGTVPFTYAWSSSNATTQTVSLPFGNYTVTSTDANTCQQTASFAISQPGDISIQIAQTDINCFGDNTGAITLTVTGGTGPNYTYTWNPNISSSNVATTLAAGNYNITVTDQANCTKDTFVALTQPAQALTANIQSTSISCFGQNNGTITIIASGGTPAYSYTWNPNVSATNAASNLSPGNYSITVSDTKNCSAAYSVVISQPTQALTLTASQTNLSCYQSSDGVASVVVTGGTSPFTYSWTPNVSTLNSATGLAAGNYTVSVTDNNQCTGSSSYIITQPLVLTSSVADVNVLCNGQSTGSITVTATGGTPAYSYSWSPNVSTTNSASTLGAGNYSITITDANNCSFVQPAAITQPPAITDNAMPTPVLCYGQSTGSLTVTASGGVSPYNFSISDGGAPITSATGQFNGLTANTYTIVVTDNNSCTISSTATVGQPPVLADNIAAVSPTCYHYTNGQVVVVATGGVPYYNYNFSNGVANASGTLSGLIAGTYSVTITDANNCTLTDSTILTQPDSVLIDVTPSPAQMKLGVPLQLTSTTNQALSITYSWTPDFGLSCYDCADPVFDGVYSQTYTVVATTQDGCTGTSEFIVTVVPNYDLFFPNAFTPNGDGINDFWQVFGNLPGVKQLDIAVFNRIGEKVFESNDINFKWDGTYKGAPAPEGVYIYTGKFVWLNNHSDNTFKGSITLLR